MTETFEYDVFISHSVKDKSPTEVTINVESQAAVFRSQFGDNPTFETVLTKLAHVVKTLDALLPLPEQVPEDLALECERLCIDLKRVASQDSDTADVDEVLAEFAQLQRRIHILVSKLGELP